jgi:hypothetical protein
MVLSVRLRDLLAYQERFLNTVVHVPTADATSRVSKTNERVMGQVTGDRNASVLSQRGESSEDPIEVIDVDLHDTHARLPVGDEEMPSRAA